MSSKLTTLAPNRMQLTGFFDSEYLEIPANNMGALVLGATGTDLVSNLTINAGHKHDDGDSRLAWRQLASFMLHNNEAGAINAAGGNEAWDASLIHGAGSHRLMAVCRLMVSAEDSTQIIPRIRVSNDNSVTTVNCDVTFEFYELDMATLIDTATISFTTATLRQRAWLDGTATDVSAASADADISSHKPLIVLVYAEVDADTEHIAAHEVAFGVTP